MCGLNIIFYRPLRLPTRRYVSTTSTDLEVQSTRACYTLYTVHRAYKSNSIKLNLTPYQINVRPYATCFRKTTWQYLSIRGSDTDSYAIATAQTHAKITGRCLIQR